MRLFGADRLQAHQLGDNIQIGFSKAITGHGICILPIRSHSQVAHIKAIFLLQPAADIRLLLHFAYTHPIIMLGLISYKVMKGGRRGR